MSDNWLTELEIEHAFEDGTAATLESLEWENIFALTEQGKYWLDFGLFAAYEHTFLPSPDALKIGPMFMKDIGQHIANVNLLFEREVGRGASTRPAWATRGRCVGTACGARVGAAGHGGARQLRRSGPGSESHCWAGLVRREAFRPRTR